MQPGQQMLWWGGTGTGISFRLVGVREGFKQEPSGPWEGRLEQRPNQMTG